ncbi:MAG: hypothetical protein MJ158_00725 [Alphaproteobacteria bacterium]|nr:hypothetical protein [Alphaproteobacteria bacterium]
MKKMLNILKNNRYFFIWTICYFVCLWGILLFLFKFNIFSVTDLHKLSHIHLHGFTGFIFGIILLTSLPIYIATSIIIIRTKKPIIEISLPKFLQKKETKKTEQENTETKEAVSPEPEQIVYPSDLPRELHIPFSRAKQNIPLNFTMSVFNKVSEQKPQKPNVNDNITSPIPIPTDFDIPTESDSNTGDNDFMPTWTDVNFDDNDKCENALTKYFDKNNIDDGEFISTEKYLIYEHDDKDFWVFDDNMWFAAGKQSPNHIPSLLDTAKFFNLTPVFYMESDNIMNVDKVIENLQKQNILVIKNPAELN